MLKSEKKRKKRRKIRYSILFVPDVATSKVKSFSLRYTTINAIAMSFLVLISAMIIYGCYVSNHMVLTGTSIQVLKEQVKGLEEEKAQLETANKELTEKVAILSDTVNNQQEAQKSQDEKYQPTGFPLKGSAAYSEDLKDDEGRPMVLFTTAAGTEVIAAGSGQVEDIMTDEAYGYCIVVNHNNGYLSYYRDFSTPCVSVGDEVTRTTVLYRIEAGGENLSYMISKDGEYINPLDIMEIYG